MIIWWQRGDEDTTYKIEKRNLYQLDLQQINKFQCVIQSSVLKVPEIPEIPA